MTFSPAHWALDDLGERIAIIATQVQDITMPWGQPDRPNWQPGRLAWVDLKSTATTTTGGRSIPTQRRGVGLSDQDRRSAPGRGVPDLEPRRQLDRLRVGGVPEPGAAERLRHAGRAPATRAPRICTRFPTPTRPVGRRRRSRARRAADQEEYYPAFSPDDKLIAFTRVPVGQEMFANPSAEMFVVPHQGDAQTRPTRLAANDPPACSGKSSPGVNNHWPKWSPDRATVGNKTYYWMIFSSNRYGLPPVTTRRTARRRSFRCRSSTSPPSSPTSIERRARHLAEVPRHLSVEPAAEPSQHDARLGQFPHSDRRRLR